MKKRGYGPAHTIFVLVLFLVVVNIPLAGQFEQKLSITLNGGYFNTVGAKGHTTEWSSGPDDLEPNLMPNFKPGFSLHGGFQVNINRHFSIEGYAGIEGSIKWYFNASDDPDYTFNYLYYEVYADTIDYEVLFSGENNMTLTNVFVGLAPKYYILPGRKVNPFVYAGIDYNIMHLNFIDNISKDYEAYGMLDQLEESDEQNWFSDHSGIGISVGGGVEYGLNSFLGVFAKAGYHFIPLKSEEFIYEAKWVDYHNINMHLGIRISFLKSKEL